MVCEEETGYNGFIVTQRFTYDFHLWEGLLPISSAPAFCCNCRNSDHLSFFDRLLRSTIDYSAALPIFNTITSHSHRPSTVGGLTERGVALVSSAFYGVTWGWLNNAEISYLFGLRNKYSLRCTSFASSWHLYTARSNALCSTVLLGNSFVNSEGRFGHLESGERDYTSGYSSERSNALVYC